MKKQYIVLIGILLLLAGLGGGYLLSSKQPFGKQEEEIATTREEEEETKEESIGGEEDEHGCLVAAGYEYDEEIGACVRQWELNENRRRGAKIAIDSLDTDKVITVIEVIEGEKQGDYEAFLELGATEEIKVVIEDSKVVEEDEEVDYEEIGEEVEAALRDKHGWEKGEMEVEVNWSDGEWAKGGVSPTEGLIGGAMWFAGKVEGNWQIIWDGNGTVMCEDVESFPKEVPSSLIEECFDDNLGKMVER